jgi:hypothetical protein
VKNEGFSVALAVIGGTAMLLLIAVLAFFVGRGCTPPPQPVDDLGIDAGPGEAIIAATLDGALRHRDEEIARIAREHAADIARFEGEQAHKYEEIAAQGPEALAGWFTDFNRRLRDGGT